MCFLLVCECLCVCVYVCDCECDCECEYVFVGVVRVRVCVGCVFWVSGVYGVVIVAFFFNSPFQSYVK